MNRSKGVDVDAEHKAFMERFFNQTDRISHASGLGFQRDKWFANSGMGAVTGADQYDVVPLAQKFPSMHRDATRNYYTYAPVAGDLIERYKEMYVTAPAEGLIDARKEGRASQRHFRLGVESVPEGVYANSYLMNMNLVKLAADGKQFTVKYERDEWGNQLKVQKKLAFTEQEAAEAVAEAMQTADFLLENYKSIFSDVRVDGQALPDRIENLDQLQAMVDKAKKEVKNSEFANDSDNYKKAMKALAQVEVPWSKVVHYWKKVKPERNATIVAGVTSTGDMEAHIEKYGTSAYQEIPRSNLLAPQSVVRNSERAFTRSIVEQLADVRQKSNEEFEKKLAELGGKVTYNDQKNLYTVRLRGGKLLMDVYAEPLAKDFIQNSEDDTETKYKRGKDHRTEIVSIRELKAEIARSMPKFQHGQNANSTTEIVHSQRSWDIYEVARDEAGKWGMQAKDWVHVAGLPMDPAARERLRFDPYAGLEFRMEALKHAEGTKEYKHNMERYKQAFLRKNLGFLTNFKDEQTGELSNDHNDFPKTKKEAVRLKKQGELPKDYDEELNNADLQKKLWNKWQEMTQDVDFSQDKEEVKKALKGRAFGPNPNETYQPGDQVDLYPTYYHDYLLHVWNHPMNAKLSLTHYGEISLSNNPPLVVNRHGEMKQAKPMQEVRLYHPSFGNYLYEHSTGDVTHSSMGGRAFGGGNIKAFGTFGHAYIHDKYMMDYIKQYNPFKNKRAKDYFTDHERWAPETFTDASENLNTRLIEEATKLSRYIFKYELASTTADDALPRIRAAKIMADTHRELTLSFKNMGSAVARFVGGGVLGAGLTVGASVVGGFALTTVGFAATAVVAPIAGVIAGAKMMKNYAETRFVDLHDFERQSKSDVWQIYENRVRDGGLFGLEALKQDASLFLRALRKLAYQHNYMRTGIESTDTVGRLSLLAGGVFFAGAITAAATSYLAVAAVPILLAAGVVSSAVGATQFIMGNLADKGRIHWQHSFFNDQGMDRYANVMQNTVADTTLRVTPIDFGRNIPQNEEYISRITKQGEQLNKQLGITGNNIDRQIRMTEAELALKEAQADLKFQEKVEKKLGLAKRMGELEGGATEKKWAENFKKEADNTYVSKEELRKILREEMRHNRAN